MPQRGKNQEGEGMYDYYVYDQSIPARVNKNTQGIELWVGSWSQWLRINLPHWYQRNDPATKEEIDAMIEKDSSGL